MPESLLRAWVQRLWAWLHTHEGRKLFRYTMTSVISTGVSAITLGIVFGVLRLWTEVPSTLFANVVGAFPSYWLNRKWAWGKGGRSHLMKEVVPFWALAFASIAFSMVGASVARSLGHDWHLHHFEQTVFVLAANIMSFGIWWVLKLLFFNKMFAIPTLITEIGEHLDAEELGVGGTDNGSVAGAASATGAAGGVGGVGPEAAAVVADGGLRDGNGRLLDADGAGALPATAGGLPQGVVVQ